jgi:RNA polymerase sigma-70 factor (ECF subfamily)
MRMTRVGPYQLQAAIAAVHDEAATAADTDWPQILGLYEVLARVAPSPVVELNRAVATAQAFGPEAGLALLDPLFELPGMRRYHLLPAVAEYEAALGLGANAAERAFLERRIAELS